MGYAPIAIPLYRSSAVYYIALMCVQAPLKMWELVAYLSCSTKLC